MRQATERQTAPPSIRTSRLAVSYHGRPAFEGVDLEISAGRITAIVGPSGCGKSSFLSSLNRLTDMIPGCTVEGEIRIGEREITGDGCDVLALRRRVGMIFQKPNPFPLTIRENLRLPMREHGYDAAKRKERVEGSLRRVALWKEVRERLDEPAARLSGGQKQRLCIARALALEPEVLLFDEPCSALDPIATGVIEDLLLELRGAYTIGIVTHNLAQARRVADRVAVFWVDEGIGTLVETGPTRAIFESPTEEITAAYVRGQRG